MFIILLFSEKYFFEIFKLFAKNNLKQYNYNKNYKP